MVFKKGELVGNLNPAKRESVRLKISKSKLSDKNPNWKGDNVGYASLHRWIYTHKPKSMFCEKCGLVTDKLDASNISGEYKRDISDFRWLCRKCHMTDDKRLDKLIENSAKGRKKLYRDNKGMFRNKDKKGVSQK